LGEVAHVLDQLGGWLDVGRIVGVVIIVILELFRDERRRLCDQVAKRIAESAQLAPALELRGKPIH
jgi:hypothetical protein